MRKVNFTAGRVAEFKFQPSDSGKANQTVYWDAKTPGLGLRVTAAGAKSYIFETRLHGKTLRITIGDVRTYSIDAAQKVATEYKSLTDRGLDPRQRIAEEKDRNAAKALHVKRLSVTFGDAWPAYIESNKSSWGERHLADHLRLSAPGGEERKRSKKLTVQGPLRALYEIKLSELDSSAIATWLNKEASARPTGAAQSYRLLRAFIRWANGTPDYRGLIPPDAYSASEVRKSVPKGGVKDDCLQREQSAVWFKEVRKLDNPVIRAYLQALLLTGARREELMSLRWTDVDFKWQTLTIRDKLEGQRTIPLTPYVAGLLQELKVLNQTPPNVRQLRRLEKRGEEFSPSPWVFFSRTSANSRLADPNPAHLKAQELAGLPHLTLHGLRRSFGTLCEWVEVPTGISAQIMGHKPSAIAEKHYRRRPIDLLRMWHEKIESWILEQAGIDFGNPQNGRTKSAEIGD